MREVKRSASMARRSSFPSAKMCCWPAISPSVSGRMRAARGAWFGLESLDGEDSPSFKPVRRSDTGRVLGSERDVASYKQRIRGGRMELVFVNR